MERRIGRRSVQRSLGSFAPVTRQARNNCMTPRLRISRALVGTAVLAAAILLPGSARYAPSRPFAGMAGVWSGNGTITLDSGASERIRCRATYAVSRDGNGLNQTLVCASDSYKFDLKSDVIANNGSLSGTWSEASRNVTGTLEGCARAGQFTVGARAA